MSRRNRPVTKDMYWFAHGGAEKRNDKSVAQRNNGDIEEENESCHGRIITSSYSRDISLTDGSNSSGPPSLDRDDRLQAIDKRNAVEERRKILWEAEQERNDAVMKKHMEREAALEARRNAQRSNISFAFGSSIPRNVDTLQVNQSSESDVMSRSFTSGSSYRGEDPMSRSLTVTISAPRGRRKNDLMPTVPYDRTATPRVATSSSSRRRSVSMTRLDQLAQPRKHYVEATKANSTASSGTAGLMKDVYSPNRPLSSASENSGEKLLSNVTRRVRSAPRKPRPISIAGTIPDQKNSTSAKTHELRVPLSKRTYTPTKKPSEAADVKKGLSVKNTAPKSTEKIKTTPRPSTAPLKASTPKSTTPKSIENKAAPKPKKLDSKQANSKSNAFPAAKTPLSKNVPASKKKADVMVSSVGPVEVKDKTDSEKSGSPVPDSDASAENERNSKRIISEEEAKAALAEKRRLAREQAEREAELERQRQEELKRLEEERLRQEEEEQRKFEEEAMRLLEEHRRQEEEKLKKAIEEQKLKEEEEQAKRDEELRMKAEQERKAKEEAEKMRLELEEKLRKEEEERAERKKRLEKIMSRTRGKSSGTSPSGSVSGSDHMESGDNQQEGFSSDANSLDSQEGGNSPSELLSTDDPMAKMEVSSGRNSTEANLTYEFSSNDVSLNSNDLMIPAGDNGSENNSMVIVPDKGDLLDSAENTVSGGPLSPLSDKLESTNELPNDDAPFKSSDVASTTSLEQEIKLSENAGINLQQQNPHDDDTHLSQENTSEELKEKSTENLPDKLDQLLITTKTKVELEITELSNHPLESLVENAQIQLENELPEPVMSSQQDIESAEKETKEKIDVFESEVVLSQKKEEPSMSVEKEKIESIDPEVDQRVFIEDKETSKLTESKDDFMYPPIEETSFESSASLEKSRIDLSTPRNQFETDARNHSDFQDSEVHAVKEDVEFFQHSNPFEKNDFLFSNSSEKSAQEWESSKTEQASNFFGNDTMKEQDFVEQPRELGEENFLNSQPAQVFNEKEAFPAMSDKFPYETSQNFLDSFAEEQKTHPIEVIASEMSVDPASNENSLLTKQEEPSHSEQTHSTSTSHSEVSHEREAFNFERGGGDAEVMGDNPFVSRAHSSEMELAFRLQLGDGHVLENKSLESDQIYFENQTVNKLSFQGEMDNVTLVREVGSDSCVGIISSIDNDHLFTNNISKLHEQFSNNYECASTTDSEESSLDSNLSQVEATKNLDTVKNSNHFENSIYTTDAVNFISNNLGHTDNPFNSVNPLNQSSIPQSAVNHKSDSEVYSNGHSESSMARTGFVQLDGNGLLSVDPSKNNIFESADAIDFGKVSPDPFPVKGSSKQIPGNPFLLQDEQNPQVLMTSDFLN